MHRRAQASLEYMLIVGFTLLILVPAVYLFYSYSSESNEQVADVQAAGIGNGIIENAAFVYFSGEGSKITLDVNIPSKISEIYILDNRELVINMTSGNSYSELVFFSYLVPLSVTGCGGEKCCLIKKDSGKTKLELQSRALAGNGFTVDIGSQSQLC